MKNKALRRKQAKENWKEDCKKMIFVEYWRKLLNESKM